MLIKKNYSRVKALYRLFLAFPLKTMSYTGDDKITRISACKQAIQGCYPFITIPYIKNLNFL